MKNLSLSRRHDKPVSVLMAQAYFPCRGRTTINGYTRASVQSSRIARQFLKAIRRGML